MIKHHVQYILDDDMTRTTFCWFIWHLQIHLKVVSTLWKSSQFLEVSRRREQIGTENRNHRPLDVHNGRGHAGAKRHQLQDEHAHARDEEAEEAGRQGV